MFNQSIRLSQKPTMNVKPDCPHYQKTCEENMCPECELKERERRILADHLAYDYLNENGEIHND